MVVPFLEHAEHRSMPCSSMLVHNTHSSPQEHVSALITGIVPVCTSGSG